MKNKRLLFLSLVCAWIFLMISYCVTNLNFPISGEKNVLSVWNTFCNWMYPKEYISNDSVLFIDVSYDKELVVAQNEYGIPLGNRAITDRKKLLKLLQYLKNNNNYKYILLDVFFPDGVKTNVDNELFDTICSMERIVIPCHHDEAIVDARLLKKAAYADYTPTVWEDDFVKYPYLYNDGVSLPLKMYEEITKHSIKDYGFFYLDNGRLVRKSVFLSLELLPKENKGGMQERVFYSLGLNLLGDSIPQINYKGQKDLYDNLQLTKDKYIIVGALRDGDNPNTAFGTVSGAIINMNAFISLMHGHHIVSKTYAVILFLIFFVLSYFTLKQKTIDNKIIEYASKIKSPITKLTVNSLAFLISWFGYSFLFVILCVVSYHFWGEVYDIFITSTLFSLLNLFVLVYKKKNI